MGSGLSLSKKQQGGKTQIITIIPRAGSTQKGSSSTSRQGTCGLVSTSSDNTCDSALGVNLSRGRRSTIQSSLLSHPPRPLSAPPILLGEYNTRLLPITAEAQEAACAAVVPKFCHSFKDCASTLSSACRCAISLASNMASVAGLASVVTSFSCLPSSARTRPGGRLGGRGRGLEDLICPCNSTFVSRSCCESVNGMVFEGERIRLELLQSPL
jgi:hypothetical protein